MNLRDAGFFCAADAKKNFSGQGGVEVLLNLRSAIAARRMHQIDLAIQLKIAPTVLSEIVNGRRQADASLRARIAQALRADEHWLFSTATRIPEPQGSTAGTEVPESVMACAARDT